jgi:hypothetical protein
VLYEVIHFPVSPTIDFINTTREKKIEHAGRVIPDKITKIQGKGQVSCVCNHNATMACKEYGD